MSAEQEQIKAQHMEGGNYYDNMLIDIAESHRRFEALPRNPKSIKRNGLRNRLAFYFTGFALLIDIYEFFIINGFIRAWRRNFMAYWLGVLNGRPFWSKLDFFLLVHGYRLREQHTDRLNWENAQQHLANWQRPSQIYSMLHYTLKLAMRPIICLPLWKRLPKGAKVFGIRLRIGALLFVLPQFLLA